MLRLVTSSFVPLPVEKRAEAITASEYGMNCEQLRADDVRRILVGFITEDILARSTLNQTLLPPRKYCVRLAHSSVIGYLADAKLSSEDFSRLALHSEAARLCFSSLEQRRQGEAPDRSEIMGSSCFEKAKGDDFFGYSCNYWPLHCRTAFAEDGTCTLLQEASKFILSEGYLTCNGVIRERCGIGWLFLFPPWNGSVCTNGPYARPGFMIAYFGLLELLEIPEIRSIVDIRDENCQGTSLLFFALNLTGNRSINPRFMGLYRDHVVWIDEKKKILLSVRKVGLEVVKRLLESVQDSFARDGLTALHLAVISYCLPFRTLPPELDSLILTIELLLKESASIYDVDILGGSAINYAHHRNTQDILIKHAKGLEEKGLDGAVQALLRMRDYSAQTPLDFIKQRSPDDIPYLESQLEEATVRNGKVMYDVVGSDPTNLDWNREKAAGYKEWIQRRLQQLENDYKAVIRMNVQRDA